MELEAGSVAPAARRRNVRAYPTVPRGRPEFPGCQSFTLKCDEVGPYEGRFEFRDAAPETAWAVREPTSATHELPSHRIPALCEVIGSVRGSPITCFGAMGLELLDEHGGRRRIMQEDQSVYLHPGRARLPDARGMVVGEHDFPDVVLEVDHTTDVRRGKLWFYEEWGFPEVWNQASATPPATNPACLRTRAPSSGPATTREGDPPGLSILIHLPTTTRPVALHHRFVPVSPHTWHPRRPHEPYPGNCTREGGTPPGVCGGASGGLAPRRGVRAWPAAPHETLSRSGPSRAARRAGRCRWMPLRSPFGVEPGTGGNPAARAITTSVTRLVWGVSRRL